MKFLRDKIDQMKKPFEKGQKFEKFAPAINALDTFLYVPNHTTKHGAHIRDAVDLKRTMITVVLALIPALIFGMALTITTILSCAIQPADELPLTTKVLVLFT